MACGCLGQRAQATADGLTTARPVELSFRNIQSQLKKMGKAWRVVAAWP